MPQTRMLAPLLAMAAAAALALPLPARADKLVRDYRFEETFNDATDLGQQLRPLNGNLGFRVFKFGLGEGLHLAKTGVTDHYTIEVSFRFEDVMGWQKIIDFKDRGSDNGLYVYNGRLQFYNLGIGGDFQAGQEYHVRLERDRNTKTVRGFVNNQKAFEFVDEAGDAVFHEQAGYFFVDDRVTSGEESPGAVSRLRIWDSPGARTAL